MRVLPKAPHALRERVYPIRPPPLSSRKRGGRGRPIVTALDYVKAELVS
jgi:hypothetical protein